MSALRFPSFRVRVWPLLLLLAGWGLLPGQAGAEPPPGAAAPDQQDFHVYRLRHIPAADAARALDELLGSPAGRGGRPRVVADPRTNAVLVSAAAPDLAKAEDLLKKMDTEGAKGPAEPALNVFQLSHREPDAALEEALQMVLGDRRVGRFVIDRERRQVLVYAGRETLDVVEALLTRLDAAAEAKSEPAAADVEVRLFWVVSGPAPDANAPVPDDLKPAAAELARLGIDKPRLAAQLSVSTTAEARFEMAGTASPDAPYRLAVTGTVTERKGAAGLEVSITVTRSAAGKEPGDVCRLRTRVAVPLDRPLVLGATPAEALKSAFVVRVQPRRPAAAATPQGRVGPVEFRDVPWSRVFEWLGDQTGMPFIGSGARPVGTFTFVPTRADRTYTVPEIIDILNDALIGQKLLLLRREHSLTLIAADEKVDPGLVPRVRPDELEQRGRTELVSLVVRLKSAPAEDVAPEVKKMLGPFGEVIVLKKANELVLQDTAGTLRQVYKVLDDLDKGAKK
jgi:type II secretory pathway component GspD/PulD (secretin)